MAIHKRSAYLVNPKRGRRLSLKQRLHFGTPAQRAAARRALGRKRKRNTAKKRRKGRRNPGHLYSLGKLAAAAVNPSRSGRKKRRAVKPMAKKRKRRRSNRHRTPVARPRRRRRYQGHVNPRRRRRRRFTSNPVRRRRRRARPNRSRRGRRNPGFGAGRIGGFVAQASWTVAGAVGTRAVTQLALGARNAGPMGYVANAAAALILGQIVGRMFNKAAGTAVTVGGFVGIVLRGVQEFTNIGKVVNLQLQGLGDYPFAGMRGLGQAYEPFDFFTPLASADARGSVTGAAQPPSMIARVAESVMPVPVSNGVAGLRMGRSRYAGARVWG